MTSFESSPQDSGTPDCSPGEISLVQGEDGLLYVESAAGQASDYPALTLGSGTHIWATGVSVDASGVASGYYDVNKVWGGVDTYMCWAAAASNMLAWWQQTYETPALTQSTVPTDVDDIFNTFKANWANQGGVSAYACEWWLTGATAGGYVGSGSDGGYYTAVTLPSGIIADYSLVGASAVDASDLIANVFQQGGAISASIAKYNGSSFYSGHAITLWGITQDAQTGQLTSIHITDSDDEKYGMFTVDVSYDALSGCYTLHGDRFRNYYLRGFDALGSVTRSDTEAPELPAGLSQTLNGAEMSFHWEGVQDASGVSYELALLHLEGNTWYIQESFHTSSTSFTTTSSATGTYKWRVRARDGAGNVSEWVYGSQFEYKTAPPELTIEDATLSVCGENKTEVTLAWWGTEGATYQLEIDGKTYQLGSALSYTLKLEDGLYDYTITATDSTGCSTSRRGNSFFCDTIAPTAPDEVSSEVAGGRVTLSWHGASDANGIKRYAVVYFAPGASEGVYDWNVSSESYTLALTQEGRYSWSVCSFDSSGKQSSWAYGGTFTVDLTPPALELREPSLNKSGEGSTRVTFSWSGAEAGCVYTLTLNGKVCYTGSDTSYTTTLADGTCQYSLTAQDASGNTSTVAGTPFTLDATSPSLALAPPTLETVGEGQTRVTFSWTAEAGSRVQLTLDGGTPLTLAGNTYSTILRDGVHRFSLTATDESGNSTTQQGEAFSTDATAPVLTLNAPQKQTLQQGLCRVVLSWSSSEAASYELWVDGTRKYTGAETSCTLELPDGEHRYQVKATDAAGNSRSTAETPFVLSSATPEVSCTLSAGTASGWRTATFSWSGGAGGLYTLVVDGERVFHGTETSWSLELSDGEHSYSLSAEDASGNKGTQEGRLSIDATAPTLPQSLSARVQNAGRQVVLSWAASQDASGVLYDVAYRAGTSGAYTCRNGLTESNLRLDLPSTGIYDWMVRARDSEGNSTGWVSGGRFCNDVEAPQLTLRPASQKKLSRQKARVTLRWASNESATYILKVDGRVMYRGAGTSRSLTLKTGRHKYSLTATDAAGNSRTSNSTLWVDMVKPTKVSKLKAKIRQAGKKLVFSWRRAKDASPVTYELRYKAGSGAYVYHRNIASTSFTLSAAKIARYSWMVRAKDAAGNTSAWVSGRRFNNDVVAPIITLSTPSQTKAGRRAMNVTLRWSSNEKATFILKVDGRTVYKGSRKSRSLKLKLGTHRYSLTAIDKQGNRRTKSARFQVASLPATSAKGAAAALRLDRELSLSAGGVISPASLSSCSASTLAASAPEPGCQTASGQKTTLLAALS